MNSSEFPINYDFNLPTLNYPSGNIEADKFEDNMFVSRNNGAVTSVRLFNPEVMKPIDYVKHLAKLFTLEEKDEAFYVCNLSEVVSQMKRWRSLLPRVAPYYAVKCNDDPVLLRTLVELNSSFDCASKGEITRLLSLGVSPDRLIYANPCKQLSMIRFAREVGVEYMTFDNVDELRKLKKYYPNVKLVLRIVPPAVQVQCVLGNKFGATEEQASVLIKAARELGLNIVGISFHVGSGCREARGYAIAVAAARRVWDTMCDEGFHPYLLDLGGGFPGFELDDSLPNHFASAHMEHVDNGPSLTFDSIATFINAAIDEYFPVNNENAGIRIIAEPGRYFAAKAYTLCCNIIARRDYRANSGEKSNVQALSEGEQAVPTSEEKEMKPKAKAQSEVMYYCNDGVYGGFNCLLYDHATIEPHYLLKSQEESKECERVPSTLYGPTCDGLDTLLRAYPMPLLNVGDWIYFEAMGAYSLASSSEFNGMPRPQVHYLLVNDDFGIFKPILSRVMEPSDSEESVIAIQPEKELVPFIANDLDEDVNNSRRYLTSSESRNSNSSSESEPTAKLMTRSLSHIGRLTSESNDVYYDCVIAEQTSFETGVMITSSHCRSESELSLASSSGYQSGGEADESHAMPEDLWVN